MKKKPLQGRTLRHREVRQLAWGHTAAKAPKQNSKPRLISKSMSLFPAVPAQGLA
jgi:hypothetical protein